MSDSATRARHAKSLRVMFGKVPFITQLGLELLEWEAEEGVAVVRMPFSGVIDNGSATPHGGAIAALIDTAGAAAVWNGHDYDKGTRASTTSISVNYLGSARDEAVIATGRCVRRARELNFVEVSAVSESGRPIASGLLTYRIAP